MNRICLTASRALRLGALSACLALWSGCGELQGEEGSAYGADSGNLSAYPGTNWAANGYTVNFCFVNSGLAREKGVVRNAINSSWGASSGLHITWPANIGTDLCPQSPAGSGNVDRSYLPIYLRAASGPGDWGGSCQPGYGGRMSKSDCGGSVACQCQFSTASFETDPDAWLSNVSIHEIGHGLGLPHEHQRRDRPSDISSTCVDPNNASANWVSGGNYQILTDLVLLTRYDGLGSIMSYCRDWDQNGVWDTPPSAELSDMDRLGIEMMYPKNYGRKPVLSGFGDASGSQYIVRSDTATQLNVDWVVRGALTGSLRNVQWANASTVLSTSPNPSIVITTTMPIWVQLDDAFGRHHPWTQTTAVPNNAMHAAITMSAANVL